MAKLEKSLRRERKGRRKQYGMRRDGDSVKTIQKIQEKKSSVIKKKKQREEDELLEEWENEE